jgi:hypothetical protein
MLTNKKRGIVIIAFGHCYYGRYAFNLALSIKAVDKDFPIAVIHSENALNHLSIRQKEFFDEMILLPESDAKGFGCKLHLDLLSPFEETLFFDADMAWMPKRRPSELFEELKEYEYASITEGSYDIGTNDKEKASKRYYFWADPDEIKKVYKLETGTLYQWRSEVIYFKKTKNVKSMFRKAREIYAKPKLNSIIMFGNQIPDELAINISTALHDIHPHRYMWTPAYWPKLHGEHVPPFEQLYSTYYLLSCGSNTASGSLKGVYDRIIKAAAYKFKMQHLFPLYAKREFIKDRIKM